MDLVNLLIHYCVKWKRTENRQWNVIFSAFRGLSLLTCRPQDIFIPLRKCLRSASFSHQATRSRIRQRRASQQCRYFYGGWSLLFRDVWQEFNSYFLKNSIHLCNDLCSLSFSGVEILDFYQINIV